MYLEHICGVPETLTGYNLDGISRRTFPVCFFVKGYGFVDYLIQLDEDGVTVNMFKKPEL